MKCQRSLFAVMLALMSLPVSAQITSALRLSVVSAIDGEPVTTADVTLSGPAMIGSLRTLRTDACGRVEFLGVPSGDGYFLIAGRAGEKREIGSIGHLFARFERDLIAFVHSSDSPCDGLRLSDTSTPAPMRFLLPKQSQPPVLMCI